MKKILFALFVLASVVLFAGDCQLGKIPGNPSSRSDIAKGLYGRIMIVDKDEDYRVRLVTPSSDYWDLRVDIVNGWEDRPGRWKIVERNEDYAVKIVEEGEDIRVWIGSGQLVPSEWD